MRKLFLCFLLFLGFLGFTNKTMGQFAGGSGTEADPYLISTPDHLVQLFYYLGNTNVHFKLKNNIDLTSYLAVGGDGYNDGAGWNPIGNAANKFCGKTFNGAGFKITGLWLNRNSSSFDYFGLFGYIDGTNISNLGVEIAIAGVSSNSYVGGLSGYCKNAIISNCYVTGNINGNGGGLVGAIERTTITNCYATSNVTGGSGGGLVGSSSGITQMSYITDCYATGNVSGNPNLESGGGLVGSTSGTIISNCHATGNVTGNNTNNNFDAGGFGGLVGQIDPSFNCSITNCYATGTITSNRNAGGLVGNIIIRDKKASISNCYATGNITTTGNGSNDGRAGGLLGNSGGSTITKCYAIGNVSGTKYVGGLIGFGGGTITNCYANLGNISGIDYVGGLLGCPSGTITNCYAAGNVSGNNNVGGFIGYNYSNVNNSFFDYQTTGQLYAIGSGGGGNVMGKSTVEMKTKTTFTSVGWDFTTIWNINEGVTYPFFLPVVGINDMVQNINVQLYPNPTYGEFRIESGELKIKSVDIFDVFGKNIGFNTQIPSENSETAVVINISHLSSGVYFVRVSTDAGEVVKKVVKE